MPSLSGNICLLCNVSVLSCCILCWVIHSLFLVIATIVIPMLPLKFCFDVHVDCDKKLQQTMVEMFSLKLASATYSKDQRDGLHPRVTASRRWIVHVGAGFSRLVRCYIYGASQIGKHAESLVTGYVMCVTFVGWFAGSFFNYYAFIAVPNTLYCVCRLL